MANSKLAGMPGWPARRGVRLLMLVAMLLVVGVVAGFLMMLSPVHWWGDLDVQRVTIAPGSNARSIANQLASDGLLRSATAFRLWSEVTGATSTMRAGVYDFSPRESAWTILGRLRRGDSVDLAVSVIIPEGYTVKQIAATLQAQGICSEDSFLRYLKTAPLPYDFLSQQGSNVPQQRRFEGYLFPDTYRLLPNSSPAEVVQVMTSRFRQVMSDLMPAELLQGESLSSTPVKMNLKQLVTLASIIEREALLDAERPLIAGVFYNRLKIGMPFGSCATVQYILEINKPVLSLQDTEVESPYNTYQHAGLPPGPIATPGLNSLQAALSPAATEYYYFFAIPDGSGQHAFSRTLAEHNAAINHWRQK
jgi:UPF0755 protein